MPGNITALSEANKNYLLKINNTKRSETITPTKQLQNDSVELSTKKTKSGRLALAFAGIAAAVAGAVIIIKNLRRGTTPDVSKIRFDKGCAYLPNGEKFTGCAQKVYDNGDKVILNYIDGILKTSTRMGFCDFEKVYKTNESGDKLVEVSRGIMKYTLNISQMTEAAKVDQKRLSMIMGTADSMSATKFMGLTDSIQYKSKVQQTEIQKIYAQKVANEAKIKAEAEAQAARIQDEADAKLKAQTLEKPTIDTKTEPKPNPKPAETAILPTEQAPVELDLSKVEIVPAYSFGRTASQEVQKYPEADYSELGSYLEAAKGVPLTQSTVLEDYTKKSYDMPLKFMISANETAAKEGAAIIADETPEIFEGIDKQAIADAVDKLGLVLDPKKPAVFTLAGRKFNVKYLGQGVIGKVFKISDEAGKSVAVKFYKDPMLTGLQGSFAEIPIMRQANLDGVIDVPKFYMANPISRWVEGYYPMGGWQMVECLDEKTPLKQGDLRFLDWLKSHGLAFGDYNAGTKVGEYISDVGGVVSKTDNYNPLFVHEGGSFMESMLRGYHKLETADDVLIAIRKLNS